MQEYYQREPYEQTPLKFETKDISFNKLFLKLPFEKWRLVAPYLDMVWLDTQHGWIITSKQTVWCNYMSTPEIQQE